jgi:hypothetical protein
MTQDDLDMDLEEFDEFMTISDDEIINDPRYGEDLEPKEDEPDDDNKYD